jgi:hypothetical protein
VPSLRSLIESAGAVDSWKLLTDGSRAKQGGTRRGMSYAFSAWIAVFDAGSALMPFSNELG